MSSKEELLTRVREAWERYPGLVDLVAERRLSANKSAELARVLGLDNEDEKRIKAVGVMMRDFPAEFPEILATIRQSRKERKNVKNRKRIVGDGGRWNRLADGDFYVALKREAKTMPGAVLSPGTMVAVGTVYVKNGAVRKIHYAGPPTLGGSLLDIEEWDDVQHPDACILTSAEYWDDSRGYNEREAHGDALYCATEDRFVGVIASIGLSCCPLCGRILE